MAEEKGEERWKKEERKNNEVAGDTQENELRDGRKMSDLCLWVIICKKPPFGKPERSGLKIMGACWKLVRS